MGSVNVTSKGDKIRGWHEGLVGAEILVSSDLSEATFALGAGDSFVVEFGRSRCSPDTELEEWLEREAVAKEERRQRD